MNKMFFPFFPILGAATGASSGRSASISVTTGLYNRNSSNTSNNLTEVDGRGGVMQQLPVPNTTTQTQISSSDTTTISSSIVSNSKQIRNYPLPSIPSSDEKESEIKELLVNCHNWNFDIIELERITDNKCLGNYL